MSIETYGGGERLRHAGRLAFPYGIGRRLVLLPIPSSRDKINITGTEIPLAETISELEGDSIIVGYSLPDGYKRAILESGGSFLDLAEDEGFLADNAYLTALGTLGYILTTSKLSVSDMSIGVIGYGRIGSALVRILLFLGAKLRVYTSKMLTRVDLGECGIDSVSVCSMGESVSDFLGVDVIVNTAPKDMSAVFRGGLPVGVRLIELASGDNFTGVDGVEKLPALPERMFPESAGAAYAEAVKRFVEGGAKK